MAVTTAMIIDDDADLGELLTCALEQRKIHAMAVQSLLQAEDYLGVMKPSYIFLDNNFPEGLGINFINQIKMADEEIKVIFMTADPAPWIREKALEQGACYFLRKPITSRAIDGLLAEMGNTTDRLAG